MDGLDGIPCKVLGYQITTRTHISLSCLATNILQLLVYLVVTIADIGIIIQHFRDNNQLYGYLTVGLLCLPAIVCFCTIIALPWNWPNHEKCGKQNVQFVCKQLFFNTFCFPIASIYRMSYVIFWTIEALVHDENTFDRYDAIQKATRPSTFQLYRFLQAFCQAAPQIILQLYILLRENQFRNYDTTNVQCISIAFSLITLAVTIASYQRFESQKIVGRNYPWASEYQVECRRKHFARSKSLPDEPATLQQQHQYVELPQSAYVMQRFHSGEYSKSTNDQQPSTSTASYNKKSLHLGEFNLNNQQPSIHPQTLRPDNLKTDNQRIQLNIPVRFWSEPSGISSKQYKANEDDINAIHQADDEDEQNESNYSDTESQMDNCEKRPNDNSPKYEAPPPPDITKEVFNRISMFKDMFILNTELFVKEKVPRLPSSLFEQKLDNIIIDDIDSRQTEMYDSNINQIDKNNGVPIIIMPTRKKMITGIEQDDFIAKSVAFTAWILFLIMRMIALSSFSVFYPSACLYLCIVHYFIMLAALFNETRFQEKMERTYFYIFLAYIYVFCILEFKIKFRKPRYWYIGYISFVLIQNLTITLIWYLMAEFESWWFKYIFDNIIISFCYCLMCLLVYFCLLKPRDKILFENEFEES